MLKILNRLTFVQKMILIFIGGVLVPMIFQNYFFYRYTEDNLEQEIEDRLEITIENKASQMRDALKSVETIVRQYLQHTYVNQYLDDEYYSDLEYYNNYTQIRDMVINNMKNSSYISDIELVTNNPTVFSGGYVKIVGESVGDVINDEVLEIFDNSNSGIDYYIILSENSFTQTVENKISLVRELDYFSEFTDYKKQIQIDLNLQGLSSFLRDTAFFEDMLLVDKSGRIIVSSDVKQYSLNYDIFSEETLDNNMVVYQKDVENTPFSLYGVYDSTLFLNEFKHYRQNNTIVALIGVLFAAVFVFIVAGNISRRINKVVNLSEQIAKGNFVRLDAADVGHDEFSTLEKSMNVMSHQLEELIEHEYQAKIMQVKMERETVKSKLFALQSQVNPHFLFNSLESIRLKALSNKETIVANMIKNMAKMFRNLITWDKDLVSVEEEMGFLNEFLNIQKFRFEDEFSYSILIDEDAKKMLIPKMIVQPLVENACVHGAAMTSSVFCVYIHARIENSKLIITVEDNGGGMTKERLNEVKAALESEESYRYVGLYNVYQRLKLYYKDDFGFDIKSKLGEGTICKMAINK